MVRPISDLRKPEIVQGAISALNKHGLSMISYDLIAEEAEMSRQLIRHYFPNPEALMVAVCDGLAATHRAALTQGVIEVDSTERLNVFLDLFFDITSDGSTPEPGNGRAYDAVMSLATGSEEVRKNLLQQQCLLQNTIASEIEISYPKLSRHAAMELGYLFVSVMYGHWRLVTSLGFSVRYNEVSRRSIDRLIASYCDHYEDPNLAIPDSPLPDVTTD